MTISTLTTNPLPPVFVGTYVTYEAGGGAYDTNKVIAHDHTGVAVHETYLTGKLTVRVLTWAQILGAANTPTGAIFNAEDRGLLKPARI